MSQTPLALTCSQDNEATIDLVNNPGAALAGELAYVPIPQQLSLNVWQMLAVNDAAN